MRPFYLPGLPMNHFLLLIFRSSQALLHGQLSLCTGRIQIKVLTTLPFFSLISGSGGKDFKILGYHSVGNSGFYLNIDVDIVPLFDLNPTCVMPSIVFFTSLTISEGLY